MWIIVAIILAVLLYKKADAEMTMLTQTVFDKFQEIIFAASNEFGVDPKIIGGIIMQETRGNANAVGAAGERGLMQLTPGALQDVNARYGLNYSFEEMFQPDKNIRTGTAYLAMQIRYFNGDVQKGIRAYNVGAGNVNKSPLAGETYLAGVESFSKTIQLT